MSENLERTSQGNRASHFWLVGLGMTLGMIHIAPLALLVLVQLKRLLVRAHASPTFDSPSFPAFLWFCKNLSFSTTMKFSLTLAVALFPAVFVNAQYSSSARPVTTSRPSTAPSASPSSAVPPSNSTNINVSAVLNPCYYLSLMLLLRFK
jgi:hypothetical protein